jgi:hypothetical protein
MKTLLVIFLAFAGLLKAYSQDEITFRNGDILKARIVEVGVDNIVYKKAENLTGPSYTVNKEKVFMIKYENGTRDLFGIDKKDVASNAVQGQSTGSPATIYFYRPGKIMGSTPRIIVGTVIPDEVIVELSNGHWFRSGYPNLGQREFVTGIYSINAGTLKMNIEPGKTYYIRCSIMKGLGLQSQLEVVDEATGKAEMEKLKEQVKIK